MGIDIDITSIISLILLGSLVIFGIVYGIKIESEKDKEINK